MGYYTDFSGATIGQAPSGWTTGWDTDTDWDVQEDGEQYLHPHNTTDSSLRSALFYDAVGNVTDIEVTALFSYSDLPSTSGQDELVLLASIRGQSSMGGYVAFLWQDINDAFTAIELQLSVGVLGTDGTLPRASFTTFVLEEYPSTSDDPSDYPLNTPIWLRFRAESDDLKAKVWVDGDTEPGWQVEGTYTDYSSGLVGVAQQSSEVPEFRYYFIGAAENGISAPTVPYDPENLQMTLSGRTLTYAFDPSDNTDVNKHVVYRSTNWNDLLDGGPFNSNWVAENVELAGETTDLTSPEVSETDVSAGQWYARAYGVVE